MSEIIYLSGARLSFASLVEARPSTDGGKPKFGADFILPPDSPGVQQFMQRVAAIAQAKWGEHANPVLQMIQSDRKLRCFGQGNEKIDKKTFKPYVGYEGMIYISAANDTQPQMVNLDGSVADPANTMLCQALARKLYGGCYVNAAVKPWPQDNKHGRAIRCELVAVQFLKDGEAFGEGTPNVTGMFGAVAAPQGISPNGAALPGAPFQPAPFQPTAAPAAPAFGLPNFLA